VRIIKAVTILMGILIVAGFALLIWRMYDLSSKPPAARAVAESAAPPAAAPAAIPPAGLAPPPAVFGTVSLGLPAGCEITRISADAGRLVLLTSCGAVQVRDLATGALLGTLER
jgi:hypothetical protein